jgi:hypothetical protein
LEKCNLVLSASDGIRLLSYVLDRRGQKKMVVVEKQEAQRMYLLS